MTEKPCEHTDVLKNLQISEIESFSIVSTCTQL